MNALPRRKNSLRLEGFDYRSEAAYFVTLVAWLRASHFGTVIDARVILSEAGRVVAEEWADTASLRKDVLIDEFVVMPNHLHGIVWLPGHAAAGRDEPPSRASLSALIRGFKAVTTARVRHSLTSPMLRLWQRGYHDRILRNEQELDDAYSYILTNPMTWHLDRENPAKTS